MTHDPEYQLRLQTEAVKALVAGLEAEGVDTADAELMHDTIEGETGLLEAIDQVLARIDAAEACAIGLETIEARYKLRRQAMEARSDRLRAMIEQAMVIAELRSLQRPAATLTMANRAANVVIDDEAKIPTRFFKSPEPVLDKKALKAALSQGEIEGAHLSQGGVTLTISRR